MPNRGDLFLYKEFQFDDGEKSNKLFIILNTPTGADLCLGIMTTSQSKWYAEAQRGCNEKLKCFFVPVAWQNCFDKDTYIQMPRIYRFRADQIVDGGMGGRIQLISKSLTKDCMDALRGCLRKFTDDITPIYLSLIFS